MSNRFERTELLIGKEALEKLKNSKIVVYGVGGVGSYVVEALSRAGVGHLVLVDFDDVDITNINRQIEALDSTIGRLKVEVMKERILEINPQAIVDIYKPDEVENGETSLIDDTVTYVVDAIDTITNKLKIIEKASKENVKIISATGAANKLDPTKFEVADIYKTSVCPVCKILRKELKQRNIKKLKIVYSKEEPLKIQKEETNKELNKENIDQNSKEKIKKEKKPRKLLGSISFVPSVAGLIIASEVVKDIIK